MPGHPITTGKARFQTRCESHTRLRRADDACGVRCRSVWSRGSYAPRNRSPPESPSDRARGGHSHPATAPTAVQELQCTACRWLAEGKWASSLPGHHAHLSCGVDVPRRVSNSEELVCASSSTKKLPEAPATAETKIAGTRRIPLHPGQERRHHAHAAAGLQYHRVLVAHSVAPSIVWQRASEPLQRERRHLLEHPRRIRVLVY